jgi:hypothetical protein
MNKINILQQPHISYPMIRNPLKPIFRIVPKARLTAKP